LIGWWTFGFGCSLLQTVENLPSAAASPGSTSWGPPPELPAAAAVEVLETVAAVAVAVDKTDRIAAVAVDCRRLG